jgi:hypothetical protein
LPSGRARTEPTHLARSCFRSSSTSTVAPQRRPKRPEANSTPARKPSSWPSV